MNETNPVRAHLPSLLDELRQWRPDDGGRMVAVQVDFYGCWGFRGFGHGAIAVFADSISAFEPRVFGNRAQ
jgi:hypothetical protein